MRSMRILNDLRCSIKSSCFSNSSSSNVDGRLSLAIQSSNLSDSMLDEVEFDTNLEEW